MEEKERTLRAMRRVFTDKRLAPIARDLSNKAQALRQCVRAVRENQPRTTILKFRSFKFKKHIIFMFNAC